MCLLSDVYGKLLWEEGLCCKQLFHAPKLGMDVASIDDSLSNALDTQLGFEVG